MTNLAQLRRTALSLPESAERSIAPGTKSFTVRDKRFAALSKDDYVQLHLPAADADEVLAAHAPKRLAAQAQAAETAAAGEVGDLPRAIGNPATRALSNAGITTLAQVAELSEAELLAMHGVGPKAVRLLGEALMATGHRPAGHRSKG
ncbi:MULTISPECIES: hypothetical protein [unclassified Streptomyces]|uniref:hypothetical protein n=1 Tax=unclassified Streptomyces TaxID=2593676 RepID=UPI0036598110